MVVRDDVHVITVASAPAGRFRQWVQRGWPHQVGDWYCEIARRIGNATEPLAVVVCAVWAIFGTPVVITSAVLAWLVHSPTRMLAGLVLVVALMIA